MVGVVSVEGRSQSHSESHPKVGATWPSDDRNRRPLGKFRCALPLSISKFDLTRAVEAPGRQRHSAVNPSDKLALLQGPQARLTIEYTGGGGIG